MSKVEKNTATIAEVSTANGMAMAMTNNQAAIIAAMSEKEKSTLKVVDSKDRVHENRISDIKQANDREVTSATRIAELSAEVAQLKESQKKVIIQTGDSKFKTVTKKVHAGFDRIPDGWGGYDRTPRYTTVDSQEPVDASKVFFKTVNMEEAEHLMRKELRNEFEADITKSRELEVQVTKLTADNKELKAAHKAEVSKVTLESQRDIEQERQVYLDLADGERNTYKKRYAEVKADYEAIKAEVTAEYTDKKIELIRKYAKVEQRIKRFRRNLVVRLFGLNRILAIA